MEKSAYFQNRHWKVRHLPFKHAAVQDVFVDSVYRALLSGFDEKLSQSKTQPTPYANYDAIILPFDDSDRARFSPLFDREFLSTLANALELDALFEVDGALHNHPAGSRTGGSTMISIRAGFRGPRPTTRFCCVTTAYATTGQGRRHIRRFRRSSGCGV